MRQILRQVTGMKVHTLTATDQHYPAAAAPPRPLPVISRLRDRWRRPGSVPAGSSPSTHPDTHTSTGRAQTTAQEIRATRRATVTDKTGRVTDGARVGAMREYLCAVIPALQPALDQFGGAAVHLVRASFDVGEHIDDPAQVLQIPAAAVPG